MGGVDEADAGHVSVDVPVPGDSSLAVDRALGHAQDAVARAAAARCGGAPALVGPMEGGGWAAAEDGVRLTVSALYVCGR